MQSAELSRERKRAIVSIALSALSLPFITILYFQQVYHVLLVYSLAFTVGYIFERIHLWRKLSSLASGIEKPSPSRSRT